MRLRTSAIFASGAFAHPITRVAAAASSSEHRAAALARRFSRYSPNRPFNACSSLAHALARVSVSPTARCSKARRARATARSWHAESLASSAGRESAGAKNASAYSASPSSTALPHSLSATLCHAVAIAGTAPALIAATYCVAMAASAGPLRTSEPTRLARHRSKSNSTSESSPAMNSGRSCDRGTASRFRSCFSSFTGRTRGKHSRSGKSPRMDSRMAFFATAPGRTPFADAPSVVGTFLSADSR
mmetsp:Transcript_6403/g.26028  ORF Transcript_6403/g.26028 Transcript_6403/m.26028 type:complete len:246 (-) Transcript_6403:736-1473(-)